MNRATLRLLLLAIPLVMAATSCSDQAVGACHRGDAKKASGDLRGAEQDYLKALQLNPNYAEARNNLGAVLLQEGKLDEAMAQFRKTLELKPDYAEARNNLGLALLQKGQVDGAIACFQNALALNPADVATRKNLDKALLQKQRAVQTTVH